MSTTATYNLREMEKIVEKNDFKLQRIKGSHKIYKNSKGETLVLGITNANKMVFQRLVREHQLIL